MSEVTIKDRILDMYPTIHCLHEVNLEVDEYLLKDRCIQNRVKDKNNYTFGKIIILFNYCKNSV